MRPIPFNPARKSDQYKIQVEIAKKMNENEIYLPIAHIKGQTYLIGSEKKIL